MNKVNPVCLKQKKRTSENIKSIFFVRVMIFKPKLNLQQKNQESRVVSIV